MVIYSSLTVPELPYDPYYLTITGLHAHCLGMLAGQGA